MTEQNEDGLPYHELVMRVVDGEVVLETVPPRILMSYSLLAFDVSRRRFTVKDGVFTLFGTVDYRVASAEQEGLVLELVSDRRATPGTGPTPRTRRRAPGRRCALEEPVTFHDARIQLGDGDPFAARVHVEYVEDERPAEPLTLAPVSVEFTMTDLTVWRMRELQRTIARAFGVPLSAIGLARPSVLNSECRRRQKNRVKRRKR